VINVGSGLDEVIRKYFRNLISKHGLGSEYIIAKASNGAAGSGAVEFKIVPPEWFELPSREYAIARGKEVIMECVFRGAKAHVFTASSFSGSLMLKDVLELDLNTISNRALFYGSLNAVMRYLGLIDKTIHCRGREPLRCAESLADEVVSKYGDVPALLVGYQPAMAKALAGVLKNFYVTDMNPDNIGKKVGNSVVLSHTENFRLLKKVKVALVTGSALVNSTLWPLYSEARRLGVELIVYGVTAAGATKVLNINRYCRFGT